MTGLAFCLTLLSQSPTTTVSLYRSAAIGNRPAYWSVEDTSLSAQDADANYGGQYTLSGGPGRTILIRFGDLQRALGPNKKVVKASLEFTSLEKDSPILRTISAVQAPWGEGPAKTLVGGGDLKPGETAPVIRWVSTWKHRRTGENAIGWQQVGAQGANDAKPIDAAKASTDTEGVCRITGLETAVQRQYDHPDQCNGFALLFDNATTFNSSESAQGQPKLIIETQAIEPPKAADLAVTKIEQSVNDQGEATYTAHIKNIGAADSSGFGARWVIRESAGSLSEIGKTLKPGEETTISTVKPFKPNPIDHRVQPIAFKIEPSGADAQPSNNSLTSYEDAYPVDVVLEKGFADKLGADPEIWVQQLISTLNETYLAHSKYSFALDGCLERVRAGSISVVNDGTARVKAGTVFIQASEQGDPQTTLVKKVLVSLGLPDLTLYNTPVKLEGVERVRNDAFAGICGWGDTRNEAMFVSTLNLKPVPVFDPFAEAMHIVPSGLLSATEVGTLNAMLQTKQKREAVWTLNLPRSVAVSALDFGGRPIASAELSFFQMKDGKFDLEAPSFGLVTSVQGSALLPTNPTTEPSGTASAFGTLSPDGSNGVFLVRIKKFGATEWAWLSAWQLVDAATRGQKAMALIELRFNIPTDALEIETNLAKGRLVTDSAGSLPAQLSSITDDDPNTFVQAPSKPGDWIDIDLGRDRTIGDITLVTGDKFWNQFDIMVYATGMKAEDAQAWSREVNWNWARASRGVPTGKGYAVSYRSAAVRFRFLRIICRQGQPGATIAEIRATPIKMNP